MQSWLVVVVLGWVFKSSHIGKIFFSLYFIFIYELTLNVTLSIDDIN